MANTGELASSISSAQPVPLPGRLRVPPGRRKNTPKLGLNFSSRLAYRLVGFLERGTSIIDSTYHIPVRVHVWHKLILIWIPRSIRILALIYINIYIYITPVRIIQTTCRHTYGTPCSFIRAFLYILRYLINYYR